VVVRDPSWRPLAWIAAEARRKLGLASGSTTKKTGRQAPPGSFAVKHYAS